MARPVPNYVCHDCGTKFCRGIINPGATWHFGDCQCCRISEIPCAEASDYGGFALWPLPKDVDPAPPPETLEDLIETVIKEFDYDKVLKAMVALDWKWANPGSYSVPSIERMKHVSRNLLKNVANNAAYDFESTGGFTAEKSIDPGDCLNNGLILRFVIEQSECYFGDYYDE